MTSSSHVEPAETFLWVGFDANQICLLIGAGSLNRPRCSYGQDRRLCIVFFSLERQLSQKRHDLSLQPDTHAHLPWRFLEVDASIALKQGICLC